MKFLWFICWLALVTSPDPSLPSLPAIVKEWLVQGTIFIQIFVDCDASVVHISWGGAPYGNKYLELQFTIYSCSKILAHPLTFTVYLQPAPMKRCWCLFYCPKCPFWPKPVYPSIGKWGRTREDLKTESCYTQDTMRMMKTFHFIIVIALGLWLVCHLA